MRRESGRAGALYHVEMYPVVAAIAAVIFAVSAHAAPTFHKDVLPLLQKHCQSCHRPGEAGPMPLLTFSQVRPWAKAMKGAVLSGTMPPWSPDRRYGKFANDPLL